MRIKHSKKFAKNNHNSAMEKILKQGRVISTDIGRTTTVLTEYELPKDLCRSFMMPEKISDLLMAITVMKNPVKEKYVAEVENKKSNTVKETIVNILPPDIGILQHRLKTAGEQAGISNLTYQMLRDTFAVMSLHAGGDIYNVACVIGIDVSTACERYKPWLIMNDEFMKGIG